MISRPFRWFLHLAKRVNDAYNGKLDEYRNEITREAVLTDTGWSGIIKAHRFSSSKISAVSGNGAPGTACRFESLSLLRPLHRWWRIHRLCSIFLFCTEKRAFAAKDRKKATFWYALKTTICWFVNMEPIYADESADSTAQFCCLKIIDTSGLRWCFWFF